MTEESFCIKCNFWIKRCCHIAHDELELAKAQIEFYSKKKMELERELGLEAKSFSEVCSALEEENE